MQDLCDFLCRYKNARKQFAIDHPTVTPTKLLVTFDDEIDMLELVRYLSPEKRERILINGLESELPQLFNLTVVYGTDRFAIE